MTTAPRKKAASKGSAVTPRQQCAVRIAAGILAGPSGGRILNSKAPDAAEKLARVSLKFVDAILAEAE